MLGAVIVLGVLGSLFGGFAVLRWCGLDGTRFTACALALTPYAVPCGLVLGGLALARGPWWLGAGVLAVTVALAATVAPRVTRRRTPPGGVRLRVLAANLYFGRGDVRAVLELVREHRVDVLHLVELTDDNVTELKAAGLAELLPCELLRPAERGRGSGLAARYPLTELALAGPAQLAQPSAGLTVSGVPVELVAVHPMPPTEGVRAWKSELGGLPLPADQAIRVLAGDFNATADHTPLRRLLRAGYADAGASRGAGLVPTWPSRLFPLLATLDHVLVDRRAAVADYRVLRVPGTDHRAVYAELVLPAENRPAH